MSIPKAGAEHGGASTFQEKLKCEKSNLAHPDSPPRTDRRQRAHRRSDRSGCKDPLVCCSGKPVVSRKGPIWFPRGS